MSYDKIQVPAEGGKILRRRRVFRIDREYAFTLDFGVGNLTTFGEDHTIVIEMKHVIRLQFQGLTDPDERILEVTLTSVRHGHHPVGLVKGRRIPRSDTRRIHAGAIEPTPKHLDNRLEAFLF